MGATSPGYVLAWTVRVRGCVAALKGSLHTNALLPSIAHALMLMVC